MTTRLGYVGTTTNLQIVLNTEKNPFLNQATQKNTCQIFLPQKIPESKISNPKKSFDHPRHLKSGVPPWGPPPLLHSSFFSTWLFHATSQLSRKGLLAVQLVMETEVKFCILLHALRVRSTITNSSSIAPG